MPSPLKRPYLHLVPIEPGECLTSWILRITNRDTPHFRRFSSKWLSDDLRVTPGFDAFPAASLLIQLGAFRPDELDHYITHHTLLGTTKCFYTEDEWEDLILTHGMVGSRIYTLRRKAAQQSWHICPMCRQIEVERGIATWQVLPQIPGCLLCQEHEVRLALCTATRIPPLAAPAEGDLLPGPGGPSATDIGQIEDHLNLARDVADTFTVGLKCRYSGRSLRDSIAPSLFGGPWSAKRIWPTLVERFGEPFLNSVQVHTYHVAQHHFGRLHPSYHGIVYLAVLARAFGTKLPDLMASIGRST